MAAKKETTNPISDAQNTFRNMWTDMADKHFASLDSIYTEWAANEKKATTRTASAVDEMATLWKDGLNYMVDLNERMRALSVDSMKSFQNTVNSAR